MILCELPEMWTKVRVVSIAKEEGGYRGLSVAVVLWRAFMTATMEQLRGWAEGILPEEVYGGIKGRRADALHERIMEAIDKASKGKYWLSGGEN